MADEKDKGGRPPLYDSVEALEIMVESYFDYIKGTKKEVTDKQGKKIGEEWDREPEPATISGLAFYLGFESKQSIYDYEKNEQFSYPIKRARLRIEIEYEKKLSGQAVAGSIFALKNMGWKDKTETELSGGIQLEQITGMVIE